MKVIMKYQLWRVLKFTIMVLIVVETIRWTKIMSEKYKYGTKRTAIFKEFSAAEKNIAKIPLLSEDEMSNKTVPLTLLIAYMRGGSTWAADILRQASGTHYLFEPIRDLTMRIEDGRSITMMNGSEFTLNTTEMIARLKAEVLKRWFFCQPEQVDHGSLLDSHFNFHMFDLKQHFKCQRRAGGDRTKLITDCLPFLKRKCLESNARTIKVVATNLDVVRYLLNMIPILKVVHLIRDPRALIHSQVRTGLISRHKIGEHTKQLCADMRYNGNILSDLMEGFNQSIKVIFYEDFVISPIETTKSIYHFAGLEYTKRVERFVRRTSLQKMITSHCDWCSSKGNSSSTSVQWRRRVSDYELATVQKICGDVLKRLRYKIVPDRNTLADLSLSLREDSN